MSTLQTHIDTELTNSSTGAASRSILTKLPLRRLIAAEKNFLIVERRGTEARSFRSLPHYYVAVQGRRPSKTPKANTRERPKELHFYPVLDVIVTMLQRITQTWYTGMHVRASCRPVERCRFYQTLSRGPVRTRMQQKTPACLQLPDCVKNSSSRSFIIEDFFLIIVKRTIKPRSNRRDIKS